jgi:hypothetical protein
MTDATSIRDELVALEERFWLEGGGNSELWRTHFADDGVVALPFGIMDKSQTIEAMARGRPWARIDMDDLRVVPITERSVLVTYEATAARADDEDYLAVIGSVYVQRDDSWQLLFHQQSLLPGVPSA